ncbi:hypothetical protein FRB93_008485 [Tulasnella sp. JGI-2019a]|nr:hypothetical protein FRB93_008485 [Tulasnella sp. JGI-2019a]
MPPLKEKQSSAFGSLGDFWIKYDTLADKFDKEMLVGLNANLEGLLIFAGLFSGVNTAFIIVVLGALSANPMDQTNHLLQLLVMHADNSTLTPNDLAPVFVVGKGAIRQNYTFFASLSCSLLAAAGAMLAKQWLQEYSRTGQTGSKKEQARRRAEKFRGAERWGLQLIVEALPTLLLISLSVLRRPRGLSLDGQPNLVNSIVYKASPFQTAVSRAILWVQAPLLGAKELGDTIKKMFYDRTSSMDVKDFLSKALRWLLWIIISPIVVLPSCLLIWPIQVFEIDELDARSVTWMAETAPNPEHILIAAENIPFITNINAMKLIAQSSAFTLLLSKFTETFLAAQRNPTDANVKEAVTMARAIACVLLSDPERCWPTVRMACVAGLGDMDRDRRWVGDWAWDYRLLFRAIFGVCDDRYDGYEFNLCSALDTTPHQTVETTLDATIYLRYRIQSGFDDLGDEEWVDDKLSSALLLDKKNVDETYFSCASRTLSSLLRCRIGHLETLTPAATVELAWMNKAEYVHFS